MATLTNHLMGSWMMLDDQVEQLKFQWAGYAVTRCRPVATATLLRWLTWPVSSKEIRHDYRASLAAVLLCVWHHITPTIPYQFCAHNLHELRSWCGRRRGRWRVVERPHFADGRMGGGFQRGASWQCSLGWPGAECDWETGMGRWKEGQPTTFSNQRRAQSF